MENEILYRYFKGETSAAEEARIGAWLKADPENHRRRFDSVRFLFEATELHGEKLQAAPRTMRIVWNRLPRYVVRVAAVVAIALGAGTAAYRQAFRSMSDLTNIVEVPAGRQMELTLADGTHVWLNAESRLEYPAVFARDARSVKLSGEAMFQVEHDVSRPFTVETFASDVRVLGTKFNVNADEEHGRFSAALLEGSVLVTNRLDPSQADIVLKPDEEVCLVDGRMELSPLEDGTSLCWIDGLLYVTGLSFTEVMDKFEQVFAVRIVIERDALPDMKGIGGKIRINSGIESALRTLQYGADFTYEIDPSGNTVTIR